MKITLRKQCHKKIYLSCTVSLLILLQLMLIRSRCLETSSFYEQLQDYSNSRLQTIFPVMTSVVLYLPDCLIPQSEVLHFCMVCCCLPYLSAITTGWQQSPKPSAHYLYCLLGETLQGTSFTGITPWSTSV